MAEPVLPKILHESCEVQGRGRRYWFHTERLLQAFLDRKRRIGWPCVRSGDTVWVPFSKNNRAALADQRAGRDPE